MKLRLLYSPLLLTLLSVSFSLLSCDKEDDGPSVVIPSIETAEEMTEVLQTLYLEYDAPGYALAIVHDDSLIYQQGFGYAELSSQRPYTPESVQAIGSISKTFIALAAAQAMQDGHFTLETDINELLPFTIVNPKNPSATIRVRHLLSHSAGLIDEQATYLQAYYLLEGEDTSSPGAAILAEAGIVQRPGRSLAEFLADYYLPEGEAYSPDNFSAAEPGSQWQYSNIASSLMAFVIAQATQTPFDTYVAERVFQPLGMTQSAYTLAEVDPSQLAQLYFDPQTPLPAYANDSYPDGSVHSSCVDMSKYLREMMRGVRGQGQLLSTAGYDQLFEPLLPAGILPAFLGEQQAMYWFLSEDMIKHDGSDPGLSTDLQFSQDGRNGFVLLSTFDTSTDAHIAEFQAFRSAIHTAIGEFLKAH